MDTIKLSYSLNDIKALIATIIYKQLGFFKSEFMENFLGSIVSIEKDFTVFVDEFLIVNCKFHR